MCSGTTRSTRAQQDQLELQISNQDNRYNKITSNCGSQTTTTGTSRSPRTVDLKPLRQAHQDHLELWISNQYNRHIKITSNCGYQTRTTGTTRRQAHQDHLELWISNTTTGTSRSPRTVDLKPVQPAHQDHLELWISNHYDRHIKITSNCGSQTSTTGTSRSPRTVDLKPGQTGTTRRQAHQDHLELWISNTTTGTSRSPQTVDLKPGRQVHQDFQHVSEQTKVDYDDRVDNHKFVDNIAII